MRTAFSFLSLCLMLPACAQQATPPQALPPPFFAPSTGWIAQPGAPIAASQVLTGPEAELYTLRAEKIAEGALALGGITAYTTYTYDAQRISTFSGYGYRYRWVVQNGVSLPSEP